MKSLKEIYIDGFKNIFNFSGRATRRDFWIFFPPPVVATMVFLVTHNLVPDGVMSVGAYDFITLLCILTIIIFFIPSISIQVRRLHNIGRSGWWILLNLTPYTGIILLVCYCFKSATAKSEQ